MRVRSLLRARFVLPYMVIAGFATADGQPRTAITNSDEVIWVYYGSLCARAGDASECQVITQPKRPRFETHEACAQYRDVELAREANPRLLGSCLKQHEV